MEAPRSARAPAAPPGCPSRGGSAAPRLPPQRLCRTFCLSLRSQRGALRPARDRPPVKRCERTGGGTAPGPGTAGTTGPAGPRPGSGAERPGPRCPAEVPPVRPRGAEGAGTAPVPSRRLAAPRARRRRGVSRLGSAAKCGLNGLAGTWLRPSLGGAGKQGPEDGLASPSIRPCIHPSVHPSLHPFLPPSIHPRCHRGMQRFGPRPPRQPVPLCPPSDPTPPGGGRAQGRGSVQLGGFPLALFRLITKEGSAFFHRFLSRRTRDLHSGPRSGLALQHYQNRKDLIQNVKRR
ncbi:basic proline-rich protein-like [Pseudopipra pipra]|uniref:basic proline-rich protein-like n=1 Tax=Pseudopipra pipra TaxID=415032 RepID=UPI0031397458